GQNRLADAEAKTHSSEVTVGFVTHPHFSLGERSLGVTNKFRQESRSVCADPVPGENHVRTPRQQLVANYAHDDARLVRIAPATIEDILTLEAKITRKGDPLSIQLRRVNGLIETVAGDKERVELEAGQLEVRLVPRHLQRQCHVQWARRIKAVVGQHR